VCPLESRVIIGPNIPRDTEAWAHSSRIGHLAVVVKAAMTHLDDSDRNANGTHLTTLPKKLSGSGTRIVDIRRLDQPIILRLLAGEPLSQRKNKSYSFLAAGPLRCIVSVIS